MPMRNQTLFAMSLASAALLGGVLHLRLNGAGVIARLGIPVAAVAMAVMMALLAGRAGGEER